MTPNKQKNRRIFQKIIIGFIVLATVFIFDFWLFSPKKISPKEFPSNEVEGQNQKLPETKESDAAKDYDLGQFVNNPVKEEKQVLREIKTEVDLSVPFIVQAPFAEWDDLHNEACEEAALIIANAWLNDKELTKEQAEKQILDLVDWQEKNWGGHYDLNVSETVRLANQYFGMERIYFTKVNDIDDVKYELSKGNIVIVPTAGRLLKNQYYRQPGPPYHMVVVKGYDKKEIITNDPGTQKGADFAYSYDNFFQAIHDWPFSLEQIKPLSNDEKAEEVKLKGEKMMIVVEK